MSLRARLLLGMVALVAAGLTGGRGRHLRGAAVVPARLASTSRCRPAVGAVAFELRLDPAFRRRTAPPAAAVSRSLGCRGAARPASARRQPAAGHLRRAARPGRQAIVRRRTFSYGGTTRSPARRCRPQFPISTRRQPAAAVHGAVEPWPGHALPGGRVRGHRRPHGGRRRPAARGRADAAPAGRWSRLLVGAGVILALVLLGWVVIRVGLRPLERIGRVASRDRRRRPVAAGDAVGPAHRGRATRPLAERDARPDRAARSPPAGRVEDRLRRFLADASHELRTPLASIRGYAELFRLGAADDPATLARAMAGSSPRPRGWASWSRTCCCWPQLDQAARARPRAGRSARAGRARGRRPRVTAPDRAILVDVDEPPSRCSATPTSCASSWPT